MLTMGIEVGVVVMEGDEMSGNLIRKSSEVRSGASLLLKTVDSRPGSTAL